MKNKRTTESAFLYLRALIPVLLCIAAVGTLMGFLGPEAPTNNAYRTLTFAERVAYQRIIEDVYWRHRIWPKENLNPKPSLDAVISQAKFEKKVTNYLRKSQALEDFWRQPITPEQLQAEMDRMAKHTKKPEVLRELFESLGNDPFVIAECLARPLLAERLFQSKLQGSPKANEEAIPSGSRHNGDVTTLIGYTLPVIGNTSDPEGGCTDDTWSATTLTNAPSERWHHTAVWTGTEMIVWGGFDNSGTRLDTGGRYDPITDTWTATTTSGAPEGRWFHTAVWTGSQMIVWGGSNQYEYPLNTGGRYDPSSDSWTTTSIADAPVEREIHTAVWSGSEMIVWGGSQCCTTELSSGGRYNPSSDSWLSTSIVNAPAPRDSHTAIWTGSEMIVWGGANPSTNTGGRYNPSTDSWIATSTINAPVARYYHTAVWTGSEMIVWGGSYGLFDTGGRYNPSTDTWTSTSITNAPTGRAEHTAVWTGSEMIVWGGYDGGFNFSNTGGRYNAETDSWTVTSKTSVPTGRENHTAVWTGSEMIVWGGGQWMVNTGGRYCAAAPSPTPTPTATATPTSSSTPPCAGCSVTSPNCGTTVFSPPTDFVVELSPPGPAALEASDFTVNGIPADSFMIVSGGATIHFYFNTSPAVQGQNTIHIAACAFSCASASVPEFTCTFVYEPSTPTPTPSEPPCEVSGSYPACNSTVSTEVTDFVVYVSYFIFKGVPASAFTVNGIPADSAEVGGSLIIFHFNASPLVQGENTMHIPPGAFSCINGRGVDEFMCTFTYQPSTPTPSPTPRLTPSPRSRPTPPPRP